MAARFTDKRRRSVFALAAVAVILGIGGCVRWLDSVFSLAGDCANQPLQRVPSPDGKLEAVIFGRNCGATTDFSTQISVLPAGQALSGDAGNVWSADSDHGAAPTGPGGGPAVTVTWQGPRSLLIRHHAASRVFTAETSVRVSVGPLQSAQVSVRYAQERPKAQ